MKTPKYLTDYLTLLNDAGYVEERRSSFLYLADNLGIETGCDFSYFHFAVKAGTNEAAPAITLNDSQIATLDILVNQDADVLDILANLVYMQAPHLPFGRVEEMIYEIKVHLVDKVQTALTIARDLLKINVQANFGLVQSEFALPAVHSSSGTLNVTG